LNPGDEVVIPAPYWVSYPDMALLAGGVPVIVEAGIEQEFRITPEQLDAAITGKTRLLVLNSPSNPTGAAYSHKQLKALGEVLEQCPDVLVATDDIYEHIMWTDEPFANIVNTNPALYERTIVINGVSKVYAMTGWRIGYAAGAAEIIGGMKKIQSQSTSNPTSIAQAASVAGLNGDQSGIPAMVNEFKRRHDMVVRRLNQLPGVQAIESHGTFYTFPSFVEAIASRDGISNDLELAADILENAGIAMVPGSAFGAEGYMRISYATDMQTLETALDRLQEYLG
jgi:aspartate aminotransferase